MTNQYTHFDEAYISIQNSKVNNEIYLNSLNKSTHYYNTCEATHFHSKVLKKKWDFNQTKNVSREKLIHVFNTLSFLDKIEIDVELDAKTLAVAGTTNIQVWTDWSYRLLDKVKVILNDSALINAPGKTFPFILSNFSHGFTQKLKPKNEYGIEIENEYIKNLETAQPLLTTKLNQVVTVPVSCSLFEEIPLAMLTKDKLTVEIDIGSINNFAKSLTSILANYNCTMTLCVHLLIPDNPIEPTIGVTDKYYEIKTAQFNNNTSSTNITYAILGLPLTMILGQVMTYESSIKTNNEYAPERNALKEIDKMYLDVNGGTRVSEFSNAQEAYNRKKYMNGITAKFTKIDPCTYMRDLRTGYILSTNVDQINWTIHAPESVVQNKKINIYISTLLEHYRELVK